jgi:hypothetical protein
MKRFSIRAVSAAAVACLSAEVVSAEGLGLVSYGVTSPGIPCLFGGCAATNQGSYGPAVFAPNKNLSHRPNSEQPYCATKTYPISDWAYIRKYCGPTIIPGTCYGHFQTKWRKWEDHCPGDNGTAAAPVIDGGIVIQPAPIAPQPAVSEPQPAPKTMPQTNPSVPMPLPLTKPVEPVAPPKVSAIPKAISGELNPPTPADPLPQLVVPSPMEAVAKTVEASPISEPGRVVVPPLPDLPMRK